MLFISETSLTPSHHMYMIEERNDVDFFFFLMNSVAEGKGERGLGRLM